MSHPSPTLTSEPRGGGPGDGPAVIRFGFDAEPVVDLNHPAAPPLYSECLARIMLAQSVLLRGGDFVGALERSGTIGLLDAAMVDLLLDALAEHPHMVLGCNVSPHTIADAQAWRSILLHIEGRPWLAGRLVLEMTESCPLNEIPGSAERLTEAKRLGCRLAIDDFGSGFATSAYLYGVDVTWDIIKLDRSCLADLRKTPAGRDGLRSLVSLATCFAPTIVAEGIETQDHLDAARSAGAHYGQGWLFDGPVPARWAVPEGETSLQLAAALRTSVAVCQPVGALSTHGALNGSDPQTKGLGDRVRALVARARMGGAA